MTTAQDAGSDGARTRSARTAFPPRLWDVATPLVRQVLRTPGLGPTRGTQASLARLLEATWDVGVAGSRYSALVARIWADVAAELLSDTPALAADPATALDPRKLLEHVYDLAERHFAAAFTTPRYVDAQAELGATMMAYRVAGQPIAQAVLELMHAASLADVDAGHRNVQDLRRTVRELRRRVRALERQLAERQPSGTDGTGA